MSYGPPQSFQPPAKPQSSGGGVILIIVLVVVGFLALTVIGCIIGMAALFVPAVGAARKSAQKMQSANNLKQISIAMLQYESEFGQLPPPFLPGKDGKPALSWRVMILPYLEQGTLHSMYDSNSPWDAPANSRVRSTRTRFYESPSVDNNTPGKTNYVVVVGPNTAFPPGKKMRVTDVSDGLSNTIFVLEIANSDIDWSEPRDLDINTLTFAKTAAPGMKNVVVSGSFVVMGDGSTVRLPSQILSAEDLKPYLTANGGEVKPMLGF